MRQVIYYTVRFFCVLVIAMFTIGCFDLDSSLFNNDNLTAYSLRTTVIPESSRTQVVLTSQGKKIYGYVVKAPDTSETNIILYNHGNRDHLQFYWDRVELFYTMGFNVFVYDYQGYGMSEGEPSESGMYSDATTAYQFVKSKGFADSSITVYGFSLGGAPAVHLASNVFTPRRLILEAAFASATTLTQSGTLIDLPSSYVMKGEYRNDEKIKNVHAPVLILHGVNDTFIDLEKNGRVLYNNANTPRKFIPVNGADHSDIPVKMGEAVYRDVIKRFVTEPQ
jgi:fermentation-respiration switch protein FrsA (DUF1100 family)